MMKSVAETKTPQKSSIEVQITRHLQNPTEPPLVTHQVFWTQIGNEVVIEMGTFDFPELRNDIEAAKKSGVPPAAMTLHVSHRFGISLEQFRAFVHDAAKLLPKDLKESL
jgi:hypothetical protein